MSAEEARANARQEEAEEEARTKKQEAFLIVSFAADANDCLTLSIPLLTLSHFQYSASTKAAALPAPVREALANAGKMVAVIGAATMLQVRDKRKDRIALVASKKVEPEREEKKKLALRRVASLATGSLRSLECTLAWGRAKLGLCVLKEAKRVLEEPCAGGQWLSVLALPFLLAVAVAARRHRSLLASSASAPSLMALEQFKARFSTSWGRCEPLPVAPSMQVDRSVQRASSDAV